MRLLESAPLVLGDVWDNNGSAKLNDAGLSGGKPMRDPAVCVVCAHHYHTDTHTFADKPLAATRSRNLRLPIRLCPAVSLVGQGYGDDVLVLPSV